MIKLHEPKPNLNLPRHRRLAAQDRQPLYRIPAQPPPKPAPNQNFIPAWRSIAQFGY